MGGAPFPSPRDGCWRVIEPNLLPSLDKIEAKKVCQMPQRIASFNRKTLLKNLTRTRQKKIKIYNKNYGFHIFFRCLWRSHGNDRFFYKKFV